VIAHSPLVTDCLAKQLLALFGEDEWHARAAGSVAGLPGTAVVEIDARVGWKA
jgi:hypothetical protein